MIKYIDPALLNVDYLQRGRHLFSVPSGLDRYRESGNVTMEQGKPAWTTTAVKIVDGEEKFSIHSYYDWKFQKELKLVGARNVPRMAEDPYRYFNPSENMWHLFTEDKTSEDEDDRFILNHFVSNTRDGIYYFLGGTSSLVPFGEGFAKRAIYSSCVLNHGEILIFDGRHMKGAPNTEAIGYAVWNGHKYVPNAEPILTVDAVNDCQSIGIGDDVFQINDWYVMELALLRGYPDNSHWCNGLAKSKHLDRGWEVINKDLKDDAGNRVVVNFFWQGEWQAITQVRGSNDFYLSTIVEKNGGIIPPDPIFDKQKVLKHIKDAETANANVKQELVRARQELLKV